MKPVRVRMAHDLVLSYGIHRHFEVFQPNRASPVEMMGFHTAEYVRFLEGLTRDTQSNDLKKFSFGTDCPVFDNLFEYCQISAGGSISAAKRLNYGLCDVAINWAGGLHHAAKDHPSGFCYVADCVLGIMELLKFHPRVMYIDIDIHHGDGVEDAFIDSDRVLTCSFHKYAKGFFPGTGHVYDIGGGFGQYYAVNVPLRDGLDDESFRAVFKPVISRLIEWFRPSAIMLQCGADSLVGDRLGYFNLSTFGHGECVSFVKSFGIPLLVVGGGGYTKTNVARCWCYETSLLAGVEIENHMPETDYYNFYGPDYEIHIKPKSEIKNLNTPDYINGLVANVIENIRHLPGSPSVQMTELPPRDILEKAIKMSTEKPKYSQSLIRILNLEPNQNEDDEE